jgi:hypothetical protein
MNVCLFDIVMFDVVMCEGLGSRERIGTAALHMYSVSTRKRHKKGKDKTK